jgi:hypothetical protein
LAIPSRPSKRPPDNWPLDQAASLLSAAGKKFPKKTTVTNNLYFLDLDQENKNTALLTWPPASTGR